jgi:hypothetical protein
LLIEIPLFLRDSLILVRIWRTLGSKPWYYSRACCILMVSFPWAPLYEAEDYLCKYSLRRSSDTFRRLPLVSSTSMSFMISRDLNPTSFRAFSNSVRYIKPVWASLNICAIPKFCWRMKLTSSRISMGVPLLAYSLINYSYFLISSIPSCCKGCSFSV